MNEALLVPLGDPVPSVARPEAPAAPRYQPADRRQLEMQVVDLDSLLPEDHRARAVWAFVEGLDLSQL